MRVRFSTLAATLVLFGCATTGATLGSGVDDRLLDHPPYYAGAPAAVAAPAGVRIGHLPIAYQRGSADAPIFDPQGAPGSPMDSLLAGMNVFLDSLGVSVAIGEVAITADAAEPIPPDVRFGCDARHALFIDDCAARDDSVIGHGRPSMYLAVGRPSPTWTAYAKQWMHGHGVDRLLVITIEVGRYVPRQRGLRGSKELELGTDYTVGLPWLTSLDTPVSVLQLTGALVDSTGRAQRIGAEGVVARRTRLLVSALGGQEMIGDEDVQRARVEKREDIPGQPLAWRVALVRLVEQLTGRRVTGSASSG